MTGSTQDAPRRSLICRICTEPVPLETSKTDEKGSAVHEECYVREAISRFRTGQTLFLPSKLARRENIAVLCPSQRD